MTMCTLSFDEFLVKAKAFSSCLAARPSVVNLSTVLGKPDVITEYLKFLYIKYHCNDWNSNIFSPSQIIDEVWHLHILDTRNYHKDIVALCGHAVEHNPEGPFDVERQEVRYAATVAVYHGLFGCVPESARVIWPLASARRGFEHLKLDRHVHESYTREHSASQQHSRHSSSVSQEHQEYHRFQEQRTHEQQQQQQQQHAAHNIRVDTPPASPPPGAAIAKAAESTHAAVVPPCAPAPKPVKKAPRLITVSFRTHTGRCFDIRLFNNATVEQLKELVHEEFGTSPEQQRILFEAKHLEDERPLTDYGIGEGAEMLLFTKLKQTCC
ncbi:hypothetical protein HDU87_005637 [Geranomyces variabilis]|uniref:Ubiquitin-like domain-containing protein n=1 Tax=Geranomyces variabilis TaxID=109894 RepID=A0AAD5XLM6_9FUNG|nr:hypothetical protein HDU87_005637 [Geranomyces variabilis]